jgi:hypothetical protein
MGREASCICEWNGEAARVKALLESRELILRGPVRKRIPFAEMKRLRADGDRLRFNFESDYVCLVLGKATAPKWLKVISTPPPSLAKKLGIAPGSRVRVIGAIDEAELQTAIEHAEVVERGHCDLIIARADTAAELKAAFRKHASLLEAGVPIWIVYPKRAGHAIGEADVRETGLAAGVVDVKVAAVSSRLTGFKFVARKSPRRR